MGFVIPSSKKKRYLSGSDWVISALDYILKTETCAGNMSQVVMMLDDVPDEALLKNRLNRFIKAFPVIHGSIARDFNLAPYWRMPRHPIAGANIRVYDMGNASFEEILLLLEDGVNRPFKDESEHLIFHLVRAENRSCLAMTFDHRLFDGRGAEMFLDLFRQYSAGDGEFTVAEGFDFTAPANLSEWMDKFYAGRNVNRKIVALSKTPCGALPLPSKKDSRFKFKLLSFSPEETEEIYEHAYNKAGYLMEMPYLLSVVIQAVDELFRKRGMPSSSYLIPVSIDLRTGEDVRHEMFFNHVSYMFFQVHADEAVDPDRMIQSIKNQMYEQVKSGLPKDIQDACLLTRIAPLPVLKKIFRIPFDGKIATFCFSHVGKSSYQSLDIMGIKIRNIFHMPRVPVPPGLGFFFNYFNGCLNLVISYLEGLIREEEILMLETDLKERLRACRP